MAMARPLAMVIIVPAFAAFATTMLLRSAIVFALALPLLPAVVAGVSLDGGPGGALGNAESALPSTLLLMPKEVLLGVVLGLLLGLPFWAAQAAGDFIDNQRVASSGTLLDPSAGALATVTGTFFTIVLIAIFYAGDGLRSLLSVLYASYRIWPVEQLLPTWPGDAGAALLEILDGILRLGLLLAAPVVLLLLAVDFVLGMVGRFAPQLNVFDLSLSAKSAIFLVALVLYWSFLAGDLQGLLDWRGLLQNTSGARLP